MSIQKFALIAVTLVSFCLPALAQKQEGPLTNAAVVKLVKAGFKEKTIISIVQSRPNQFDLGTEQLIQLKRAGVSENIILTMLSLNYSIASEDDWNDDESFMRSSRQQAESTQNGSQDPGTNIFGSSNGSRSKTENNQTGRGGGTGESNVTGSATVRIIRPPSEAGGAPAKLERTPTLTNETVIQLVDAGFSEGTIIKRIESSPVEFDLSATKLEELRKRRVSEPIIAAMTSAMSEDAPKPRNPQLEM